MAERDYGVLFLCTGNSARSVMAEGILAKNGAGPFPSLLRGKPAQGGSEPVRPRDARELRLPARGLPLEGLGGVLGARRAFEIDFVFTVCDSAAAETCPVWPGHPVTAHWGIEDPAAVEGTDLQKLDRLQHGVPLPEEPDSTSSSRCRSPRSTTWPWEVKVREIGAIEGATANRPKAG